MSLLLPLPGRTTSRRPALMLAEEPHFDPRAVRRAIAGIDRSGKIGPKSRFAIRSDLEGYGVADARRTRRDVLRFLYCHEWLHWYMREIRRWRSGAETACDRFALRNFRRRQVTLDDALDALRGCRTQPLPSFELAA